MYDIIVFKAGEITDPKHIRNFIALPKKLYSINELTQEPKTEKALLNGKHVLSHYFTMYGAVAYSADGKATARCSLTCYPDDDTAYFGHFECCDENAKLCNQLFLKLSEYAKQHDIKKIIGPVDASFWLKYRFKDDEYFGEPYSCEPYNQKFYPTLLKSCGFKVYEKYISNHYILPHDIGCEKYTERLNEKLSEGYRIESPESKDFDRVLREVYGLLIELYSGFPAYKRISEEEFCILYNSLRYIIDYSMVKMVYCGDKPVAFFISIPNYGNLINGSLSLSKLLKIQRIKRSPESYVMLYMGVDPAHRGLGKALAETIREVLRDKGVPSVGALIRDTNSNRDYMAHLRDFNYSYVLLEKQL